MHYAVRWYVCFLLAGVLLGAVWGFVDLRGSDAEGVERLTALRPLLLLPVPAFFAGITVALAVARPVTRWRAIARIVGLGFASAASLWLGISFVTLMASEPSALPVGAPGLALVFVALYAVLDAGRALRRQGA